MKQKNNPSPSFVGSSLYTREPWNKSALLCPRRRREILSQTVGVGNVCEANLLACRVPRRPVLIECSPFGKRAVEGASPYRFVRKYHLCVKRTCEISLIDNQKILWYNMLATHLNICSTPVRQHFVQKCSLTLFSRLLL